MRLIKTGIICLCLGSSLVVLADPGSAGSVPLDTRAPGEVQSFGLGEVVVTAERETLESPTTISRVTAEEIESNGATNLGEALRLVPGVLFRQARSINEFYVTVRGFEQENVLILLDGVPISVPYEGVLNLVDIPVQNIAEIKVIKGAASTLYGPNAMGGVINIITKKGTAQPTASASYQLSEYNTHHLQASHGWKLGNFTYFLGASHRESDGFRLAKTFSLPADVRDSMAAAPANPKINPNVPIAADDGRRDNSDYNRDAVTLTGTADIAPGHQLGLSFEYYDNEYGVPAGPFYREHKTGFFYFPRYRRFDEWQRYTVNVIEESRFSDAIRIKVRGYYDNYRNVLDTFDGPSYTSMNRESPPSGRSVYDDYSAGGNVYLFLTGVPSNELRLALSYKKDYHTEQFKSGPTDILAAETYSVAVEDEYNITNALVFTAGASFDGFNKLKREQAASSGEGPGKDITTVNPQAGLRYEYSKDLSVYGTVAKKIRFPTMRNLYATGVVGPLGNPDLSEEHSINYELGIKSSPWRKVSLESAVFYNDITDLINFDNQTGRFEQYSDASIAGFELDVNGSLTESLSCRIGYTFLSAKNHGDVTIKNQNFPDLVYRPETLPYRPQHKIDIEATQTFHTGTTVNLGGTYVSERTYYNHADPTNNKILVGREEKLASYFLLNGKITQELGKHFLVFLSVENALNAVYQDLFQFPGRGRTFWGGIKVEI